MRQFSATLLSCAPGPLIAFLSAPCGRHSTVAGRRRRRSTRVRRYVPAPPPAPLPPPRLAPPGASFPAEDIALVRPYFTAHERSRAAALRRQWKDDPGGDLLGEPAPRSGVVGTAGPRGRDAFSGLPHTRPARQRQAAPA
ncbi:hypothetical protein [Nocardiopsis dassonvillei]|uniref:hypothetical protein n=1 Tax=Nocardiopsis dassonvillei TaxID=2014 RepID=UPI003645A92F